MKRDDDIALLLALGLLWLGSRPRALASSSRRYIEVTDLAGQYSPLAERVTGVRDPLRARIRKPGGLCVHTTGGGVLAAARQRSVLPITEAIRQYIAMQNGSMGYLWGGPAYVCDYDGTLYQLAPDNALTAHAGAVHPAANRAAYLDGSWERQVSPAMLRSWRVQWPHAKSPADLYPGDDANAWYVGVEMLPVGNGFGGAPMRPGLRFTWAQHQAVSRLARDLGERHGWPADWQHSSRLLGHEDVNPIDRSDAGGGWDPGWLRIAPYFDFRAVRDAI